MPIVSLLLVGFFSSPVLGQGISLDYINSWRSGGETTVVVSGESSRAFEQPAANLSEEEVLRHTRANSFFDRNFSSDHSNDLRGLGPVFNNSSCISCHTKDGRGALPLIQPGQEWVSFKQNESLFLRISIETEVAPPKDAQHGWGAPLSVPDYTTQLFHLANYGVRNDIPTIGQARVWMRFEYSQFTYPDGESVKLKKPIFKITDAYSPRIYQNDVRLSPRMGTPMIGLGLLEAITEADILALARRDLSSEGVFGKPNYVFDIEKELNNNPYPVSLGRFGLKANTPSVLHQALGALNGDLGVTNYAFPLESIFGTRLFETLSAAQKSTGIEAHDDIANDLVFYSQTLAVPSRRNITDEEVIRGGHIFHQVNCTSCHHPSFTTGHHPIQAFSHQKIFPFTDMLLHDMGPGLADNRRDFDANGRQWKTRPLWGIGHTQTINPRAGFLHDGRAKTLEEAILWHDGEARYSRAKFANLSKNDRKALIRFLRSL